MTALLVLSFLALRLIANVKSVGGFVIAGDRFSSPGSGLPLVHGGGYDGQFVWRLAHSPWTQQLTADGVTFDNPAYRQQRVALPALVWLLHGATGLSFEFLLLLVNSIAVMGIGFAAACLARQLGRQIALSAGVLLALARDLNEPLASLALLGGLIAWTAGRWGLAIVPFCLAALARETTLAVIAGIGVWSAWQLIRNRDWAGLPRTASLLAPLAVAVLWQLHVARIWGPLPFTANNGNVGIPIVGVFTSLWVGFGDFSGGAKEVGLRHLWLVERTSLLIGLAYLLLRLRDSRLPADLRAGFAFAVVMTVSSSAWRADVQFLRVANEAVLMGLLVAAGLPRRPGRIVLLGSATLSVAVGAVHGIAV